MGKRRRVEGGEEKRVGKGGREGGKGREKEKDKGTHVLKAVFLVLIEVLEVVLIRTETCRDRDRVRGLSALYATF